MANGLVRATPEMIARRPNVATNSLKSCAAPARTCSDALLRREVARRGARVEVSVRCCRERHRRVEVRAGHGTEGENQRDETRARGDGVGEEGDGDVAPCEPVSHDAGADDRCEEERRPKGLGDECARAISHSSRRRSSSW
jgi:hypothetical protein